MTKRKKVKKVKFLSGCPKCGGHWTRKSGFITCSSCGHVAGTQHVEGLKSNFGQRVASHQVQMMGQLPSTPVDDEDAQLPIAGRAKEL